MVSVCLICAALVATKAARSCCEFARDCVTEQPGQELDKELFSLIVVIVIPNILMLKVIMIF